MIKNLLISLGLIVSLFTNSVSAEVFQYVGSEFDWALLSKQEKTERISNVYKLMFPDGKTKNYTRKEFKTMFKRHWKDNDYKTHYDALEAGYRDYKNVKLEPYYYKDSDTMYMYALQYKNDLTKTYYYSSFGKLRFVDIRTGDIKNCPCQIKRYKTNGKLVRSAYIQSKDIIYLYNNNGNFEGVQYKSTLYTN